MKIVFIGCVEFSFKTLEHLLSMGKSDMEISGIVTRKESSFNSDFFSLVPIAEENNIPCLVVEGNDQSAIFNWIKDIEPDVIFCFGWSYLLNDEILNLPRLGAIGYHPAKLPQNRGRHPIVWALVLGLQEMGSTFFFMNNKADAGDILNQKVFPIEECDDAGTIYQKIVNIACEQIPEFTTQLIEGDFPRVPQKNEKANYLRKRNKRDGEIKWEMAAKDVHDLVRALTHPYVGAHFVHNDQDFKVWKTEVIEDTVADIGPGKVLSVQENQIEVRCGEGSIKLIDHEYLMPIKEGDSL